VTEGAEEEGEQSESDGNAEEAAPVAETPEK